jgi:glutamate/aspartate transport system substrate-binding protein
MKKLFTLTLGAIGALAFVYSAFAAELTGTLKRIDETDAIRIGYRQASPPFSFFGPDGKPTGYSVELCLRVAETVKNRLKKDDLTLEFIPVTSDNRIDKLLNGTIDIECGSTSHTMDRREMVDFSYFTFITGTRILVKKDAGVHDYKDLAGKSVAVTKGTTNEARVRTMSKLLELDFTILAVRDHDAGFEAVKTGKAVAYATDDVLLRGLMLASGESDNYALVGNFLSYDPYALMMRRDDAAFRLMVDRTLADLFYRRDLQKIFDKWFAPLGIPLSGILRSTMTAQMHVN